MSKSTQYQLTARTYPDSGILFLDYSNGEQALVSRLTIWSQPENSTAIAEWEYDPKRETLTVIYKNGETRYTYEGVPMKMVFLMMSADSLGSFVAREIKPKYSVAGVVAGK